MSPRSQLPLVLAACLVLVFAACAKEPPISIGKKDSLLDQGIVITVTNTSDEHLHEVVVHIESPEGETRQYSTPTLEPHETVNVGWLKLEGWPIPDGSLVSVTCKGYGRAARWSSRG